MASWQELLISMPRNSFDIPRPCISSKDSSAIETSNENIYGHRAARKDKSSRRDDGPEIRSVNRGNHSSDLTSLYILESEGDNNSPVVNNNSKDDVVKLKKNYRCLWISHVILLVFLLLVVGAMAVILIFFTLPAADEIENLSSKTDTLYKEVEEIKNAQEDARGKNATWINPCTSNPCIHGDCRLESDSFRCICESRWTGYNCSDELRTSQTSSSVEIEWKSPPVVSSVGWKVTYTESEDYPNKIQIHTMANNTKVEMLRPSTTYRFVVENMDYKFDYYLVKEYNQRIDKEETMLVEWDRQNDGAENGYLVTVERIEIQKRGLVFLPLEANIVTISNLDTCSEYTIHIWTRTNAVEDLFLQGVNIKTDCVYNGWKAGDSVVVHGWNGGAQSLLSNNHCDQPDNFPPPVRSPSCQHNNANGNVGESVINTESHSGSQSWHYKRGAHTTARGQGTPFTPQLKMQAGRTDKGYTADSDGFYCRLWFKAANTTGDGSSIEISLGSPEGNDRVSTMIYITAQSQGIYVNTFEAGGGYSGLCTEARNCSATFDEIEIAKNLDLSEWHELEMELLSKGENYGDKWTFRINGDHQYIGGAYLQAYIFENQNQIYKYINRIKFRTRYQHNSLQYVGFYFDDIHYETFNWHSKTTILDSYTTGFEHD